MARDFRRTRWNIFSIDFAESIRREKAAAPAWIGSGAFDRSAAQRANHASSDVGKGSCFRVILPLSC
jgi:hypothetical protein